MMNIPFAVTSQKLSPAAPPPVSLDMLDRLIAYDTTSFRSNLDLIHWAADWLKDLGATIRLTHDDDHRKANLFATIGPAEKPGILLSGHSDVVPVEGQEWSSDPFKAVQRDGKVFGRGAADMKGFLAAALALAPEFAARPLAMPIHFALSYDEEVGCVGVRRLIQDLAHIPVLPRLCIVGEPTEMKVIIGHKGKKNVRCHVHGKECHSAFNHKGVNAVEIAAEMVTFLRHLQRRIREQGPFDTGYEPPYTTIHTGIIEGGTALNIVPKDCSFEFEIRNLPEHDVNALMAELRGFAQDLVPEMLEVDPDSGILFNEYNTTSGLMTRRDDEAAVLACQLTGSNDTMKVSFTTEAGLFHKAGISAVVCGPGSIAQAHKPDEFIEIEQLIQCEGFLRRLMDRMV